jgi:arginyl-tRNA synthetase
MGPTLENATTSSAADPALILDRLLRRAIAAATGLDEAAVDPMIRPSQSPQFGDFQSNCAMGLAKQLASPEVAASGTNLKPRDIAMKIVEHIPPQLLELIDQPEVAGPGFINLRLKPEALAAMLDAMDDESLGIEPERDTHPMAIDLCGVNVAKQMHVGHLRSTIIGDALARVEERLGRRVFRENHLGDWGLPIAMVLTWLREKKVDLNRLTLDDLDRAYRLAQLESRDDERGLAAARRTGAGPHRLVELQAQHDSAAAANDAAKRTLIRLQQGDPSLVADWHKIIDVTMNAVYESIDMLGVRLGPENNRGESFYRDKLEGVVDAFVRSGIAVEDQGALVVRFDDRERPLLIRKSDGGYLYATTDLAAVRYRVQELGATRVIYVVDARQRDHFKDVFDAIRRIGWDVLPDGSRAELIHLPFGSVLGPDRRPFKTRSGDTVTLKSLLVEAIERGTSEVLARAADPDAPTHGLPDAELRRIGKAVGIGAVKYADLSSDLVRDYVFNLDRMITFEGNTGPYLQYAHARVCSIFTRAGLSESDARRGDFLILEPAEKQLALKLLKYPGVVRSVARALEPHRLCTYLFELADTYSSFYEQCPVLKAESAAAKASRLRLCDLVRRVLADGLALLGIEAPRRM